MKIIAYQCKSGEECRLSRRELTERLGATRVPPVGAPRFVGRESELAALASVLAAPPVVVLIEGEAGIGKSRLVQEYLAAADGTALVAGCPPFRRPHTLGPVADAFRQAVEDVRSLRLTGLAGALRPLFPEWADVLPPVPEPAEDATAARYRLFRALAELIGGLSVGLLLMEDAQWADEATLEFLLFLASRPATRGRPGGSPVSLVITCRPEDVPPGSLLPRLARLAAATSGLRLSLHALDMAGTEAMVSSMLDGEHLSEEFARFLHEHTGGVPLAVEESVRLLAARADLRRRAGQWVRRELAELAVPPPVRDAVLERAGQLAPDAQSLLHAAAVLGDPATEPTLTAVAGFDSERAQAGLSQALCCGLLADDRRGLVSFRHVLACRAVYESVPGPQRRLLHLRAGLALEGLSPRPLAALARHFREAGDTGRWLRYGEQAADQARAVGDEATAAVLLRDLITEAGLPAPAIARLASKIVLLALPADDQLRVLATALRDVLDAGGLMAASAAELRFQLGRTLFTMQEHDASRRELEQAVAGLPPDSLPAVRAMMLLGWPQGSNCPAGEHLRWLRRAAAADATVPPAERLRLLVDRASALLMLGEQDGWAEADRIPQDAAAPRDRLQVIRAHGNLGEAAIAWGRYAEARRRLEHAVALAGQHHYARFRGAGLVGLAHLDWLTGAWAGLAERAAALAADDDLAAVDRPGVVLVSVLLQAATEGGEQGAGELSHVADEAIRRGALEYMAEPAAALARLHLAASDVTQALKVTEDAMGIVARKGVWLWAADLVPARVAALAAAGRADEATALTAAFAAGLRGRDIPVARAGLVLSQAIVAEAHGQPACAAGLFGRAEAVWQALPRPYDALLARERQGRCLLAAGNPEAGLSLLTEAQAGLFRLGATGDADRVARDLRQQGIAVPRPWRGGGNGYGARLSPRELDVVRLVAAGRTNKEIAAALFRSPYTVRNQIQSAMRKLGVSTRAALASAAAAGTAPDSRPGETPKPSLVPDGR